MGYRTHGLKYLSLNPIKIRPEYYVWSAMKSRCNNPNSQQYNNYGCRGIKCCDDWLFFDNFFRDMGVRPSNKHSLDRIDNSRGYSKENCRWATHDVQDLNKRTNRHLEFNDETLTVSQWAKKIGIRVTTLWKRLDSGWSIEAALTTKHRYINIPYKHSKTLKDARLNNRLTLREVQKLTGIPNAYIAQIENGKIQKPKIEYINKLCATYGIALDKTTIE